MRRGVRAKIHFFKNFFISFHISIYKFIASEKHTIFRPNAQVRPTKGNACPVGCAVRHPIGVFCRNGKPLVELPITVLISVNPCQIITLVTFILLRPSTLVESALQITPFYAKQTQFLKSQMNVKPYNTTDYENIANWTLGENKPKQSQFARG